ncbi:protein kinase domain-containing protein [Spirillospora sp. CA-294931]|uniref:serine/threonine-protein kinase n=1 Tax=Spirillospora sp. CA-294931 TaxID=3240042 RepID=UPI003D8BE6B0
MGPYRLTARLGGGGMGQVYLGRSRGGRPVAVKVVRAGLAADAEFRRRFAVELEAARRVGGFYTAQVVDADPDPAHGPPWLATAYIAGPSLHETVARHGPLRSLEEIAGLGAGLAEGLAAIHACDLVHRDLKPANVIIASDGPRVIDFGIARALDATSHTVSRAVVGTPSFMSPEQARGDPVGPASDVFSLGAVLAFAATGCGPFGTGPAHAIMYRIIHNRPDLDGLPRELRSLVSDCLAKQPGRRPSLDDVLRRLDRHRETTPEPAPSWPFAPSRLADRAPVAEPAADGRLLSGFGLADDVGPPERCPDCGSEGVLPTDVFCRRHDRFLPLVNRTGAGRVGVVLAGAVCVYALFWLAAAVESAVPVFVAVAAVGMLGYLLPLRTHSRTVALAATAYVFVFGATSVTGAADGDTRQNLAAMLFVLPMVFLGVHIGLIILGAVDDEKEIYSGGPRNDVVALGAIPTALAATAGLGWLVTPLFLDAPNTADGRGLFRFVGLLAFCGALGVSGVAGLTVGLRRAAGGSPRIPAPSHPRHVAWYATFSDVERRRTLTAVDRLGELTRITVVRIVDLSRIVLVTGARVAVNAVMEFARLLVLLVVETINLAVRIVVFVLRAIVAVAVCFAESAAKILGYGLYVSALNFGAIVLPVVALLGAALLAIPLSEHVLAYLREGATDDLGWFALQTAAAFALVSAAWILNADQDVRRSLLSAYRTANVAGPYLLVFVALGGWIFTALSVLGLGEAHPGWITWTATALLTAALIWSQFRRSPPAVSLMKDDRSPR